MEVCKLVSTSLLTENGGRLGFRLWPPFVRFSCALALNESSLKSYNIPSYFKGKYLFLWIRIQNNVIKINFSGSKTISATHPNIQNKDENLSIIYVSDSPFTIQRGLITKNNYNQNSDAYKDIRGI